MRRVPYLVGNKMLGVCNDTLALNTFDHLNRRFAGKVRITTTGFPVAATSGDTSHVHLEAVKISVRCN